jgi:hypothetical protein
LFLTILGSLGFGFSRMMPFRSGSASVEKNKEKSGDSKDRLTYGQFTPNLIRFTQHSLHHSENAKNTSYTIDV